MARVHHPSNQCWGKARYSSRKEAKARIRHLPGNGNTGTVRTHAYRCPHCSWWHIGRSRTRLPERTTL